MEPVFQDVAMPVVAVDPYFLAEGVLLQHVPMDVDALMWAYHCLHSRWIEHTHCSLVQRCG